MGLDRKALYNIHSKNLAAVDSAIKRVRHSANRAIAEGQLAVAEDFARVYAWLLAAKLETRLRKALYEPPSLEEARRDLVLSEPTQEQRWLRLIDEAFMRRYNVPRPALLDMTPRLRRTVLTAAVTQDLLPIMQLRNKLAHGEWSVALTSAGTDVSPDLTKMLHTLNLLTLKHQDRLIGRIGDAVTDLVVSRPTFERDFDAHFRAIEDARKSIASADYQKWVDRQRASYRHRRPSKP